MSTPEWYKYYSESSVGTEHLMKETEHKLDIRTSWKLGPKKGLTDDEV